MSSVAVAKSLQSCPTLCNPIDGSPPVSPIPRILQAKTLEWVAMSFSSAWKWKVKVKLLSRVQLFVTPKDCNLPGSCIWGFPGESTGVGCHCLLCPCALNIPQLQYSKIWLIFKNEHPLNRRFLESQVLILENLTSWRTQNHLQGHWSPEQAVCTG